jgi:hypothetical protein
MMTKQLQSALAVAVALALVGTAAAQPCVGRQCALVDNGNGLVPCLGVTCGATCQGSGKAASAQPAATVLAALSGARDFAAARAAAGLIARLGRLATGRRLAATVPNADFCAMETPVQVGVSGNHVATPASELDVATDVWARSAPTRALDSNVPGTVWGPTATPTAEDSNATATTHQTRWVAAGIAILPKVSSKRQCSLDGL